MQTEGIEEPVTDGYEKSNCVTKKQLNPQNKEMHRCCCISISKSELIEQNAFG